MSSILKRKKPPISERPSGPARSARDGDQIAGFASGVKGRKQFGPGACDSSPTRSPSSVRINRWMVKIMAPGASDGKNEIEALRALNAQLTGRLQAVETLAVASLGLYLANSSNDPDFSKSRSLLDFIRNFSNAKANDLEPEAADAARHHADDLLSQVLENLRLLRGGS